MRCGSTRQLAGVGEDGLHLYTCPLCEAMCGLEIQVADGKVTGIRGNREDTWSAGHICPKAPRSVRCTRIPTASGAR